MMRRASVAVLILASLAPGCPDHQERAPITCVGEDCGLGPGKTGLPTNPEGGSGPVGEGGSGAGTDSPVNLVGNVRILGDDLDLDASTLVTDGVDLKAVGENGKTVTGTWDGQNPFTLAKLPPSPATWVLATPRNPMMDDALPGLDAVPTTEADASGTVSLSLYLVHATSMDRVLGLASNVPLTRDSGKAQLVLRFVARSGAHAPLSGLAIAAPSAEDVLYGASKGFSDVATETDNTGVVVLANVPAAAWPGALVNVQVSGAKHAGIQVRAVTGAVTVASLLL